MCSEYAPRVHGSFQLSFLHALVSRHPRDQTIEIIREALTGMFFCWLFGGSVQYSTWCFCAMHSATCVPPPSVNGVDKHRPLRDKLCLLSFLAFQHIFTHLCILQTPHQSPSRIHPSMQHSIKMWGKKHSGKADRHLLIYIEKIVMQVIWFKIQILIAVLHTNLFFISPISNLKALKCMMLGMN